MLGLNLGENLLRFEIFEQHVHILHLICEANSLCVPSCQQMSDTLLPLWWITSWPESQLCI